MPMDLMDSILVAITDEEDVVETSDSMDSR